MMAMSGRDLYGTHARSFVPSCNDKQSVLSHMPTENPYDCEQTLLKLCGFHSASMTNVSIGSNATHYTGFLVSSCLFDS